MTDSAVQPETKVKARSSNKGRLTVLLCVLAAVAVVWWYNRHERMDRALLQSVMEADAPATHDLLDAGADPNVHFSLLSERHIDVPFLEWIKSLIRTHRVERRPNDQSLLLIAVGANHVEIARDLIKHGASVNVRLENGTTPLLVAALKGRSDMSVLLLDHGARWNIRGADGMSPLQLAARFGNANLLEALIQRGASIFERDKRGWTPLMLAAEKRQESCIRILLEHGAQLNELNSGGPSPLQWAGAQGSVSMVTRIWDSLDAKTRQAQGPEALRLAVGSGSVEAAKALLDRGVPIPPGGALGDPPLSTAASAGQVGMVELLLNHGAKVNEWSVLGQTPLMRTGSAPAIVTLLLKRGADPNMADKMGRTALRYCFNEEAVGRMLAAGANPNIRDQTGATPLLSSISEATSRALLKHGADPNIPNNEGLTPLIKEAWGGNLPIVRLLLDHGARVNDAKWDGKTALAMVMNTPAGSASPGSDSQKQIIGLLKARGAVASVPKSRWRGTAPPVRTIIAGPSRIGGGVSGLRGGAGAFGRGGGVGTPAITVGPGKGG